MSETIAIFSDHFGQRIKTVVENVEKTSAPLPPENKATILAGYSSPVEISEAWRFDGGTWICRARRLFRIDGVYQMIGN